MTDPPAPSTESWPSPDVDQVRAWLADYVSDAMRVQTLERIVTRLDDVVVARIPELADRDMRRDLAASTRAQVRIVLSRLASDTFEFSLPQEAHVFARSVAQRGFELRLLLRVYHVGMEAVLAYMTEVIEQRRSSTPGLERVVLLRLFELTTKWVSASVELLTDTYMQEREHTLRAALNRRTETVRALLAGDEVDAGQASTRLGYRLRQQHVAFVLWTDELGAAPHRPNAEATGSLERVAVELSSALGSGPVFIVPSGASALWAWVGVEDAEHGIELGVPGQVERRTAAYVEAPFRVAFGAPGEGVSGFRQSHREAVAARQVVERSPGNSRRAVGYPTVEIPYLVGVDDEAMRGLVRRELGALAGRDANTARLRETLRVYLRSRHSPEAAAKELGVHKNTVRYRMQRIEQLMGFPIETRSMPVQVALDCVAVYGADILS
ncbi:CdaR family transcriptional regulator [Nocardia sp. CNY236]|uniref:PucR family transcriptional regulator n=1 Tax=Nocardia sp. CNY236 TaxID=1169152 RepID=UPI0012DE67E3|nr:helix-turn-helix domain-containing protein [Nocardia sp. CNY236]